MFDSDIHLFSLSLSLIHSSFPSFSFPSFHFLSLPSLPIVCQVSLCNNIRLYIIKFTFKTWSKCLTNDLMFNILKFQWKFQFCKSLGEQNTILHIYGQKVRPLMLVTNTIFTENCSRICISLSHRGLIYL